MINIDSNQGRIGEFWWINSDQSTGRCVSTIFAGAHVHLNLVQWGSCGIYYHNLRDNNLHNVHRHHHPGVTQ